MVVRVAGVPDKPWYEVSDLFTIPRRDDMFADPVHVHAVMQTARAAGKTVRLEWLAIETDESDRDVPVHRRYSGVSIMDVIDYFPMGWAYIAHPLLDTVLAVSLDVITDIRLEPFGPELSLVPDVERPL